MSRLDAKVAIVTGGAILAGDGAGFMSGSILFCDGGITSGPNSGAALAAMQGSAR